MTDQSELRRSAWHGCCRMLAARERWRPLALRIALAREGGAFYSRTAREILHHHQGVEIGAYSYGECFCLGAFPAGVRIGRYVSVASGVRAFLRNHPLDRLSLHPFFYNRALGFVEQDTIETGSLEVGHDAWLGERAIITPGCRRIGIGAVVGAGAVVTHDVPDFAVVAGNPARLLRYRFEEPLRVRILASRWWERPVQDCVAVLADMVRPLPTPGMHPLLAGRPVG